MSATLSRATAEQCRSALAAAMGRVRQGWTQGAYARNAAGTAVPPDSDRIARVDLAWALRKAADELGLPEELVRSLVQAELPAAFQDAWGLERWNDRPGRTRTEIILVLERAISRL